MKRRHPSPSPLPKNRVAAAANGEPKAPRPPANQVLQSFLNQWGIVLVQGLGAERTEGGKMIVGPTLNALYKDQIQQQQQAAQQQQPQPAAQPPTE